MFVIGNNCCGGMVYRMAKIQFNNPFMWAVCPYRGIKHIMEHFHDINWGNITLSESKFRKRSYIITVDKAFPIHFVHYKFNKNVNTPTVITNGSNRDDDWSSDIEWNHIWEYVVEKYMERVKRMVKVNELPCFLLHEDKFDNEGYPVTLKDIADHESPYKRIIITTDTGITRNDGVCKIIHTETRNYPKPSVREYYDDIIDFIG